MHPYVHFSIIYNNQDLEAAPVPMRRWDGMENYSTAKRKNNNKKFKKKSCQKIKRGKFVFCISMDIPGEYYPKWNNPKKDKYIWFHLCGKSCEESTLTKKKETDS